MIWDNNFNEDGVKQGPNEAEVKVQIKNLKKLIDQVKPCKIELIKDYEKKIKELAQKKMNDHPKEYENRQDTYYVQETYTYTEYGKFPRWEKWTERVVTRRGFWTDNPKEWKTVHHSGYRGNYDTSRSATGVRDVPRYRTIQVLKPKPEWKFFED